MSNVLDTARRAYTLGLCVLPVREDGSKMPDVPTWRAYQDERPSRDEMRLWFVDVDRSGLGLLCGAISGDLEMFEFDDRDTFDMFIDTADAAGLGDLVERIRAGYEEATPGIGAHWFYCCEATGRNTELAKRPKQEHEKRHPEDNVQVLIETRGNGGFAVIAPSNGKVHETGRPYQLVRGGLETIVTISPEERDALFELARAFDQMPKTEYHEPRAAAPIDGDRPGDLFNERGPSWRDLLEPHGWTFVSQRGEVEYWRRPGKAHGVSATINGPGVNPDRLYVFTSSTIFEAGRSYTKFQAHTVLNHGGDFTAAAKALGGQGYRAPQAASSAVGRDTQQATVLPQINAGEQHLPTVSDEAWHALERANVPPYLFRFGGLPSRIEHDDDGTPAPRTLTDTRLRHELARAAAWHKLTKDGEQRAAMPPIAVVHDMLAHPNLPLPILAGITEAPAFSPDGSLHNDPGYDPRGRTYYAPATGFEVAAVPMEPTPVDVGRAKATILDDLLGDFPFTSVAERAHAVGLLILPFVRGLIAGPTPLHLIEKPTPGTGATLLTEALTYPATGRPVTAMTEGRDEDEWRKRITAKLRGGSREMFIDNLKRPLISAALSAAMTATVWEDRLLGTSDTTRLPIRCSWIATGNNPTLSSEIGRRTVRIRLDAKQDRPWQREGFRHADLRGWMQAHRAEIVWSALTLTQAWIAAGRPTPEQHQRLGMYESWSDVIGGILSHAGIAGFLTNLDDFYESTDTEGELIRAFLAGWWEAHADRRVGVAELYEIAVDVLDLGDGSERSQKTRLGKQLRELKDRVYTLAPELTVQIVKGRAVRRAQQWSLKRPLLPGAGHDEKGEHGERGERFPLVCTAQGNVETPDISQNVNSDTVGNVHHVHTGSPSDDFSEKVPDAGAELEVVRCPGCESRVAAGDECPVCTEPDGIPFSDEEVE